MSNNPVSTDQNSADPQVKIDETNSCFRPFITLLRANVAELLKKIPAAGTRAVIGNAGNVSGHDLWTMYLDSAPDPVERQSRNCSCCRHFFHNYANLIQLTADGLSHSLLFQDHDDQHADYRSFLQAAQEKLRNARIERVLFAPAERAAVSIGVDEAGGFNHMHFHLENVAVRPNKAKTSNQNAAALREDVRILTGSFGNWSDPIIKRGIELFANHERLSRSTHAGVIAEYADIRETYKSIKHANVRHNYATVAALTSRPAVVRLGAASSVTGEFLTQSEKVNENFALQRFLSQTSAEVYMRPVAAPTSGAVAAAEKLFAELDLAASLKRRPLRRDELVDQLWTKPVKEAPVAAGVFGGIKTKDAAPDTKTLPIIKGGVTSFLKVIKKILAENPDQVQVYIPHGNTHAFSSITTQVDPEAKPILRWDSEDKRNPLLAYRYQNAVHPSSWGQSPGTWAEIIAIAPNTQHQPKDHDDFLSRSYPVLEKGYDMGNPTITPLFPEALRGELHGVRSVIEQYCRQNPMEDIEQGLAVWSYTGGTANIRLTKGETVTEYQIVMQD
ncbi:hypothetical protein [Xanthomonas phage RTH11]|nr:hypothetical protein [Xanthomonas phage RTH11]